MYRVWYWQNAELFMVSCGIWANYAWRIVTGYYALNYRPYLEYIKKPLILKNDQV